jgi:hypothetical protein
VNIWEKRIIDAFISNYFASASDPGENRSVLRIRSSRFFPDFDTAHPNEKESYLEAAETLERKGLVQLHWEKRGKGERLKTLSCENFEMLFNMAGKPFPKAEAEKIRSMLGAKAASLKAANQPLDALHRADQSIALLEFFSQRFGPREIGQGIDYKTMDEFIRLLEFSIEPARLEKITTRALSILLYRDSKRLENLLGLCKPLLTRAQKTVLMQYLWPRREFPETMISGKIAIEFKNSKTPMVNAAGHIFGLPLENAEEISGIQPVVQKSDKTVLTIENKETFYALASPQKHGSNKSLSRYDCFLYTGGYPNRAAAAIIRTLAVSGFSFYHAGDLDPDGVLILQNVSELAGRPVSPVRMDAATFDLYRSWARHLGKPMLRQIEKINMETKAVPELAGLLRRIEETGLGVEQEIVDYR